MSVAETHISRSSPARAIGLFRAEVGTHSFALTALLVFAVIYTMYFARSLLLPMVLSLLLSYLLAPLVRALAKIKIPRTIGAAVVMLTLIGVMVGAVSRFTTPAAAWMEHLPYSVQRLQERLSPLKKPIQQVSDASAQIEKIAAPESKDPKKSVVEVNQHKSISGILLTQTPEFLTESVTMLILLYFLLVYDEFFLTKLIKVIPRLEDKKRAITIAHEIENCVSRYLLTITLINIGLGTVIAIAMYFLGLPNPLLWGAMAATLNFVPYLGAIMGIVTMTLAAVLSSDSLSWALVFPATYLAIAMIEGNFITPTILGHSLAMNPIVILVALMFWGWIWGFAGVILAVPILATLKIFCDHVQPLAPLGEFLSR